MHAWAGYWYWIGTNLLICHTFALLSLWSDRPHPMEHTLPTLYSSFLGEGYAYVHPMTWLLAYWALEDVACPCGTHKLVVHVTNVLMHREWYFTAYIHMHVCLWMHLYVYLDESLSTKLRPSYIGRERGGEGNMRLKEGKSSGRHQQKHYPPTTPNPRQKPDQPAQIHQIH